MHTVRAASIAYAARVHRMAEHGVKEGKAVQVGGLTKAIWFVAGWVGAIMFVLSFGSLLMPLIAAVSWWEAIAAFVGMQWTAATFMDLHQTWIAASGWLYMLVNVIRRKKAKDLFSKVQMDAAAPQAYATVI
jgi:hypothetical protein